MPIEDFYLDQEKVTSGVRVALTDREGKLTDDWLMVRSGHSDEVRAAMDLQKREMRERIAAKISDNRDLFLEVQIALIASWSFDAKCTVKSKREFLTRAPHIADQIDTISGNVRLFFPDSVGSS